MRILGLDMGSKRVGVALSDEMGWTAQGLTVLDRRPDGQFLAKIKALTEEHQAGRIVVGLPRRMDGTLGPEAQNVLAVVEEIKAHVGVEVDTWDERLSTVAAERVLIEADLSRKKRKKVVDKVAATYILQSYLDYLGTKSPRTD